MPELDADDGCHVDAGERPRPDDLVEQDHRVRAAADGLGELAAFVVADVAGRGADQAGHGVLRHVLAHVDAHHGMFVVEEELGQGAGEFGFADAGGAEEQEAADGPVRGRRLLP